MSICIQVWKSGHELRTMLGKKGALRHMAMTKKDSYVDEAGNRWYPMTRKSSVVRTERKDERIIRQGTGDMSAQDLGSLHIKDVNRGKGSNMPPAPTRRREVIPIKDVGSEEGDDKKDKNKKKNKEKSGNAQKNQDKDEDEDDDDDKGDSDGDGSDSDDSDGDDSDKDGEEKDDQDEDEPPKENRYLFIQNSGLGFLHWGLYSVHWFQMSGSWAAG